MPENIVFTWEDREISLLAVYEVCDRCSGHGKIVNPNVDEGGISAQEFIDDPEFEQAYFGGLYDIPCPICEGKRVVAVPDFNNNSVTDLHAWKLYQDEKAYDQSVMDAEKRFGA